MPTNETPSAEAVTRAYTTQETCQAACHTITGMCAHCAALVLDAFARELCDKGDQAWEKICREREATVWEKAARIGGHKHNCEHLDDTCQDFDCAASRIRAHTAEERTKP